MKIQTNNNILDNSEIRVHQKKFHQIFLIIISQYILDALFNCNYLVAKNIEPIVKQGN
jgi:hypothetical protein